MSFQKKPRRERIFEPKGKEVTDPMLKTLSKLNPNASIQEAIPRKSEPRPAVNIDAMQLKLWRKKGINPAVIKLLSTPFKDYDKPHQYVTGENVVHQADTLFLSKDEGELDIGGEQAGVGMSKALVVVDVGTRWTAAAKLENSSALAALKALIKIYSTDKRLRPPSVAMQTDQGSEFQKQFTEYIQKGRGRYSTRVPTLQDGKVVDGLGILHKQSLVGRSRQVAMVEAHNKFLAESITIEQANIEYLTGRTERAWVTNLLPKALKELNDALFRSPDVSKVAEKDPRCIGDSCDLIPKGTKVRAIADYPADMANNQKLQGKGFRVGDVRWQKEIRTVVQQAIKPGNPPLYILNETKKEKSQKQKRLFAPVAYTKAQLQIVDEADPLAAAPAGDTDVPPPPGEAGDTDVPPLAEQDQDQEAADQGLDYPNGTVIKVYYKEYKAWFRALVTTQTKAGGIDIKWGDGEDKNVSTTLTKTDLRALEKKKEIEKIEDPDVLLELQVVIPKSIKTRMEVENDGSKSEAVRVKIKGKFEYIRFKELERRLLIGTRKKKSPLIEEVKARRRART